MFKGGQQSTTTDKGPQNTDAEDKNVICDDEEECHLHPNKPKKVSSSKSCQPQKNLAQKLSSRLCRRGSNSKENKTTGNQKSHEPDEEEEQPTLSFGQPNSASQKHTIVSSCSIHQLEPKIEVVTVDVVSVEKYQTKTSDSPLLQQRPIVTLC